MPNTHDICVELVIFAIKPGKNVFSKLLLTHYKRSKCKTEAMLLSSLI